MPPSPRFRAPDQLLARRMGEQWVVVDLERDFAYTLSCSAGRFWELLGAGETLDSARRRLLDEFEVAEETLDVEMEQLHGDLLRRGLLVEWKE